MCTVCGCGETTLVHQGDNRTPVHHHGAHRVERYAAGNDVVGAGDAQVSDVGVSQRRLIEVETDILAKNDRFAAANRARLAHLGVFTVNLVSSPGAGKTTLLCRTVEALGAGRLAVIEGDQQTANDAERIRATGVPAVQVNTGKGCHLDAHMVAQAIDRVGVAPGWSLFIENVGNLVCPAAFDLGEDAKIVIWSVTEGEDKPLKYPEIFSRARLAVLSKTDLAPYCEADLDLHEANLRRVNPDIASIRLSAKTGEGMGQWIAWLKAARSGKTAPQVMR